MHFISGNESLIILALVSSTFDEDMRCAKNYFYIFVPRDLDL